MESTQQKTLWETLSGGIKSASSDIWELVAFRGEATLKANENIMTPVTKKAAETVSNTGKGVISILGLEWPIIFLLIGAVLIMFLILKLPGRG